MTQKIALITGGMGGIGTAICREFCRHHRRVITTYKRAEEKAKTWQREQNKAGFDIDIYPVDVADFDACAAMVKEVEEKTGEIEILVNNAGITRDHFCSKMTKEDWNVVIDTDLSGTFYVTRAVINGMRQRKYGRIINISSINGQKGQFGQVNYAAAKAGIHGFTKALALEVAKDRITVNTISPGYVRTDMITSLAPEVLDTILAHIPMGRFAEPEEIARVVTFLADEKNTYITGANIAVNGGHYML